MKRILPIFAIWMIARSLVLSQSITTNGLPPVLERGTYHNYFSCTYPAYGTFATFGDASGTDTRLGEFLAGWDTATLVPTNQPVSRYLIRSCQIAVVINDGLQVVYDPTHDDLATYFETNNPAWVPDSDAGRPIELFGVAFRNGYGETNFQQCSAVGSGLTGSNNVYAICWTTNGQPKDVGNNIGKTNVLYPPFETWPFAVAQTTAVMPGETLSPGNQLTFDLDLSDPFVVGYLQRALQKGRLNLMISSLHRSFGQAQSEPYPSIATRFNGIISVPTPLNLEVTVVRDLDTDSDGLPDDWEHFYFNNLTNTASGDFDGDEASNEVELHGGTNPTLAASVFRITSVQRDNNQSELHWPNLPSRRFEVDYSDDLATWQTITNPPLLFPTPASAVWSDLATNTARFYRVRAAVN